MANKSVKIKKNLNANSLLNLLRECFGSISDLRDDNKKYELADILMSAFAVFSLKSPSILAFKKAYSNEEQNLHSIYQISEVPGETRIRETIDTIKSSNIQDIFPKIFKQLEESNELEKFLFMGEYYLVSGDGTEYFASKMVCCDNCMRRNLKNGSTEYYHQFYGAAIVHPAMKQVIPLASEPIIRQDGDNKNDCERNASKRFLTRFKNDHPQLPAIIIEDALASNAPHIKEILNHNFHYILGVKEADHKYLFAYVKDQKKAGNVTEHTILEGDITHIFSFINDAPLNKSNEDVRVNFLEYWELNNKTGKKQHFSYVTDFKINRQNTYDLMRGGRARWKIENETFNTLKNQDYHFEHNYGHGKENLSVNFALLMMLAFLIDQTLEISCELFQGALEKKGQRIRLWETVRHLYESFVFDSMNQVYEAIFYGYQKPKIEIIRPNTS